MIYLKQHDTEKGRIIAMCDEKVLGRVLSEGVREVDLNKYAGFYRGELVNSEKAAEEIGDEKFYSANVVGEESVKVFLKKGMADQGSVAVVEGVPFIQIFLIE
jgi:hypothetical protein